MSLRSLLLTAYYHGSRPLRWWDYRCAAAIDRVPACILAYHRVADDRANEWTISRRAFRRQIDWLRRNCELVSLDEVKRAVRAAGNQRRLVSITFDDGYADNCREVIPWLVKERIPCTYFVTAENVLDGRPFEHDVAQGRPLAPNNVEQLRAMAAAGVEIGSHTYTHADLGRLDDPQELRHEVVASGKDLAAALDCPVRWFAFPFGHHRNLSSAAFELARRAGYEAACSAYGGVNYPGGDSFHLQRICVDDCMARMQSWVMLDRRKLAVPRFRYKETLGQSELCRRT